MEPHRREEDHRQENVHYQEGVVELGTQRGGREAHGQREEDKSHDTHDPPLKVLVDVFISCQAALNKLIFCKHTPVNDYLEKGDSGDPAVELVEGRKTPSRE